MPVLKKKKKEPTIVASELSALAAQERAVAEQIAKMEEMISSAPDRIRREYEESRTLMPPPDDWEDRQRAKRFNAHLSKGEIAQRAPLSGSLHRAFRPSRYCHRFPSFLDRLLSCKRFKKGKPPSSKRGFKSPAESLEPPRA